MRRGEVWTANLNPSRGREIGKIRPVLIIQANELIDVVTSHYQAEALKNATNDSGDGLAGVA